jgi:hypothetical protein
MYNFLTEVNRRNPNLFFVFFIPDLFHSLPRGVEPKPARYYSGALTIRQEAILPKMYN